MGEPDFVFPVPSAPGSVQQRVGTTDVEINYSRPNKNGREIFGKLVPWGAVWRTGANATTNIKVSAPVRLGGQAVPAGRYALFTIPGEHEWTLILSRHADQWGSFDYRPEEDLLRLRVPTETLPELVETFTISVTDVHTDSARLCLEWDRTRVAVPLQVEAIDGANVGQLFPDFQTVDLDGKPFSVSTNRGKVVLIDFWATWCVPCVREAPALRALYEQHHAEGLEIIGVSLDDDANKPADFTRAKGIAWPQFCDGKGLNGPMAGRYGVDAVPTMYLVGRDGRIIGKNLHGEALESAVQKAVAVH